VGNFGYRAGISGWEMTEAVKFGLFQGAFYYGTFRGLAAVTSGAIITKVKGLAAHLRDSGADPEAIIAAARPEAPATPPATPPAGTPPEAPPSGLASALAKPDLPRLRRPGKSGAGADPQPGRDNGRDCPGRESLSRLSLRRGGGPANPAATPTSEDDHGRQEAWQRR
jgi:hypothetical protein